VRRWTLGVLAALVVLFAWSILADRLTPYWLRAGVALNGFADVARQKTPAELRELVFVPDVRRGALLWQFGELCTAEAEYRRELKVKATVLPIRGSEARRVAGSFLAPVACLLRSSDFIALPEPVRATVAGLAAETKQTSDELR
jgi:hypothetical protein